MSINHRAEAEKHLTTASRYLFKTPADTQTAEIAAAIGLGHAALACNEGQMSTAADMRDALTLLRRRESDMRELVAHHIAAGLASREKDRWQAAIDLARALDEAHCNVDALIDARLADDGWDPRSAWKAVSTLAPGDDPWAPTPDITADVPEPVRRVIAGHLAEILLGNQSEDVHQWARGVAFELKRVGADITPDIEKRIRELTLGRDPSEPPF